jgi:hypothetical protein
MVLARKIRFVRAAVDAPNRLWSSVVVLIA